jgi:electron transport complex protein RnfC
MTHPDADRVTSPSLSGQLAAVARGAAVSAVVCCLLDTDPTVPLNAAIAATAPVELLAGVEALAAVAGVARPVVVADPEGRALWAALRPLARRPSRVRLVPLRNDYPQSDPSLLLFTLLHRRLAPGRLPTECGVLLVDGAAAADVGRSSPASVEVAVRDHFAQRTHLLSVPPGTPLGELLRFVDVDPAVALLRAGEFLRDRFVSPDLAVTAAGERVFHATARTLAANPDPCVRCGWCVEACPTRVHPAGLLDAAQQSDPALAERYGLSGCIECGICSYVCPTRLPLLASIRQMKSPSVAPSGTLPSGNAP